MIKVSTYFFNTKIVKIFDRKASFNITTLRNGYHLQETGKRFCCKSSKKLPKDGPSLSDFVEALVVQTSRSRRLKIPRISVPYIDNKNRYGNNRKVYFDVYGCQMNVNDTEVVWSILRKDGFVKTDVVEEADVVLIVTCAIRESAEEKIWNKIEYLKGVRNKVKTKFQKDMKIGILGCMAERLKDKFLEKEKSLDLIAGPDSYKDLPRLLALTENNQTAVNVLLSLDETYADVMPVRLNEDSVTAFVSIMRGCDNMCTYCIVPFTRGRERSRPIDSIVEEVKLLSQQGVKEVTLLGQNVNSYRDLSESHFSVTETQLAKGFKTVYKTKKGGLRFANLLEKISRIDPEMRIRFTSPHPKDFPDEVLELIRERPNICSSLHLPAQSGSSTVLERMRRGYTREAYLDLIAHVRAVIPGVTLSSDFICGFCGETDEEFEETLSLVRDVKFNMAYLFPYSMREKTPAHRRYKDDVPEHVKRRRLATLIALYRAEVEKLNKALIGTHQLLLIEGNSRRLKTDLAGRNDGNIKVIIPNYEIPVAKSSAEYRYISPGDYVVVLINAANSQTLKGIPLYHTTLADYHSGLHYNEPVQQNCIA